MVGKADNAGRPESPADENGSHSVKLSRILLLKTSKAAINGPLSKPSKHKESDLGQSRRDLRHGIRF
jgi:hypothetical protein